MESAGTGQDTGPDALAVAEFHLVDVLHLDQSPAAVALLADQREAGEAVQRRQQAAGLAARRKVGGMLPQQLRLVVQVVALVKFQHALRELLPGQRQLHRALQPGDHLLPEDGHAEGTAQVVDALALAALLHLGDRQRIVQVLAGRARAHHADHATLLVEQGASAVAGRSGGRETQPFPAAVLVLGRQRGQQAVAQHHAFTERIADGVDRRAHVRHFPGHQRRGRAGPARAEHHIVLVQREPERLVHRTGGAVGAAQVGPAHRAAQTGSQHMGVRHEHVGRDGECGADGPVAVVALGEGQQLQRQGAS
ncbi:MAG: hypothetical protein DIU62_006430 [Pseudomonadota bacterium]